MLQGTTGSGKTIVYFEALKVILKKGYQGLIMLPEIGLTNQFEKKFLEFFGIEPAIWHSGISKKNKEIIWSGIVTCLLYTSPSPRDKRQSRMPSSA